MSLNRIICAEEHCPYHRNPCCFGEVDVDTVPIGGDQIRERHKCKAKNSHFVKAKFQMDKGETA